MSPTARRVVWGYLLVRKDEKENLGISKVLEEVEVFWLTDGVDGTREKMKAVKGTMAIRNRQRITTKEKGDCLFLFMLDKLYNYLSEDIYCH